MEAGGNHGLFIAEDEQGIVHGYLSMTMSESPHIIGYWQAVLDSIYVDTEGRKAKVAINLIKQAEKYAVEMGCASMTIGFKTKNPHTKFAESIGYEPDDIMYTKLLEGVE